MKNILCLILLAVLLTSCNEDNQKISHDNTVKTEEGEERLNACVFKLAVGDKMVSMCEMNATDLRAKIDRMQIRSKAFAEAQVTVED